MSGQSNVGQSNVGQANGRRSNAARKKRFSTALVLVLVGCLSVAAAYHVPNAVSQLTYAVERGKAQASKEQLATANSLSDAFKLVAKSMRPSVVSISSVKRVSRSQPQIRRFDRNPGMPDELRRFFDDDLLGRFFNAPTPPRGFQQRGIGTGVLVSRDGYILTNNHVVAGADEVKVRLSDKREFDAEVIGADKPTDLAVLKINAKNLVAAPLGDSTALEVGDWVLAVGSPFGLDQTVTAGIVSAVGRANVGIADYEDFIQTDAAINPGNSGGPLVNLRGEVVGINTAIASRSGGNMGVGFAIPAAMAKSVMAKLIDHGRVERGYLGAVIQDLNKDLAASFGFKGTQGVLIGDVVEGGPADNADLRSGDIVLEINGRPLKDANHLRHTVAAITPGEQARLKVFRNGKEITVKVEIGRLQAAAQVARGGAVNSELGMTVRNLTPELAARFGLKADVRGALVASVSPDGSAAAAGIRPGDLVVSINSHAVENAADFRRVMKDVDPSEGIRMQLMRDGVRRFVFLKSQ